MYTFDYTKAKEIAKNTFNLSIPIEIEELKAVYRSLCKKYHPDLNKTVDHTVLAKINSEYEYLVSLAETDIFASKNGVSSDVNETVDGIPLNTLGRGLGVMVNGTPCNECKGKGYYTHTYEHYNSLYKSQFAGKVKPQHYKCYKCDGVGELRIFNPVLPKGRLF